jgi:DNA-binding transcriptional LysR family regulator
LWLAGYAPKVALSPHVPDLASMQLMLAVARTGSLGAAGRELGLTQQAASWRMRSVEKQVGVRLLNRGARGSTLTDAGALLANWVTRVLDAADELDAAIAALRGARDTQLDLAASYTIAEYLLPGWLVRLRAELGAHTGVNLTVRNSEQVAEMVLASQADLGFVEGPDLPSGLSAVTVAEDTLVLVVPPTHRWAKRRRGVEPEELAGTALVTREQGSGTRMVLERALTSAAPDVTRPAPVLELAATTAIRQAVVAGAGPAVLSHLAVRDDLATGRLVQVRISRDLALRRQLRGIWPEGPPSSGPARALLAIAGKGRPPG